VSTKWGHHDRSNARSAGATGLDLNVRPPLDTVSTICCGLRSAAAAPVANARARISSLTADQLRNKRCLGAGRDVTRRLLGSTDLVVGSGHKRDGAWLTTHGPTGDMKLGTALTTFTPITSELFDRTALGVGDVACCGAADQAASG